MLTYLTERISRLSAAHRKLSRFLISVPILVNFFATLILAAGFGSQHAILLSYGLALTVNLTLLALVFVLFNPSQHFNRAEVDKRTDLVFRLFFTAFFFCCVTSVFNDQRLLGSGPDEDIFSRLFFGLVVPIILTYELFKLLNAKKAAETEPHLSQQEYTPPTQATAPSQEPPPCPD